MALRLAQISLSRANAWNMKSDAIARKEESHILLEAKHHVDYHTLTGLDESRMPERFWTDVTEGFRFGTSD